MTFLVVPKSEIKNYSNASDREYFSRPVAVERLYTNITTRLVRCFDSNRGCEFWVDRKHLKSQVFLSCKQRQLAGI
jgi:hypothetical protein